MEEKKREGQKRIELVRSSPHLPFNSDLLAKAAGRCLQGAREVAGEVSESAWYKAMVGR